MGQAVGCMPQSGCGAVFLIADLPTASHNLSCADAIFATQEVIARCVRGGSRVYVCLYDLQKAFDSVEYPVLLEKLYDVSVIGKMWILLKNWYDGGSCSVRVD